MPISAMKLQLMQKWAFFHSLVPNLLLAYSATHSSPMWEINMLTRITDTHVMTNNITYRISCLRFSSFWGAS